MSYLCRDPLEVVVPLGELEAGRIVEQRTRAVEENRLRERLAFREPIELGDCERAAAEQDSDNEEGRAHARRLTDLALSCVAQAADGR